MTDEFTRVIQIWFLSDREHLGLPPQYEQVKLTDMSPRQVDDAVVRDIIGPNGATDSHVSARLTSAIVPPGGCTTIELPQPGEDLFLYIVDGEGQITGPNLEKSVNQYDVALATPQAEAPVLIAGETPLNFLSFYLKPFLHQNGDRR